MLIDFYAHQNELKSLDVSEYLVLLYKSGQITQVFQIRTEIGTGQPECCHDDIGRRKQVPAIEKQIYFELRVWKWATLIRESKYRNTRANITSCYKQSQWRPNWRLGSNVTSYNTGRENSF